MLPDAPQWSASSTWRLLADHSDVFPRNVFNTRWLGYVPVAQWLLEMWPYIRKYVAPSKRETFHCHTHRPLEAASDPLFTVRLNCGQNRETDRPLLSFLASNLHHTIKHLLYRFMKGDIIYGTSSTRLSQLNLSNIALMGENTSQYRH